MLTFRFLLLIERYHTVINRTLALASEKSSFYRSLFGTIKLDHLPEMRNLPFTTPEELKEDPYRMLCVHPNEIIRIVTLNTSGSTGIPKRVFFTEPDLELCTDYFHHGMLNLVDETDIVGILFPFQTPASSMGSVDWEQRRFLFSVSLRKNRITLPEIVAAIEQQTEGLIQQADLAPSSCDHPRCGFHGDFVIMPDKLVSLTPKGSNATSSDCCCKTHQNDHRITNRRKRHYATAVSPLPVWLFRMLTTLI